MKKIFVILKQNGILRDFGIKHNVSLFSQYSNRHEGL